MGNDSLFERSESAFTERVDTSSYGPLARRILDRLKGKRVIGQDRAAERLARSFAIYDAGLKMPTKPINAVIFAGPTGVGKTLMAEELARGLIADEPQAPLTLIDCTKLTQEHQITELIGAPPSYVGYGQSSKLDQMKIEEHHLMAKWREFVRNKLEGREPKDLDKFLAEFYVRNRPYLSVILFDEIEKAHPKIHTVLLNIIDKARLDMSNGDTTFFGHSVVIMTCNIGGRRALDLLSGRDRRAGFRKPVRSEKDLEREVDQAIYEDTLAQIIKFFPGEFVGRIRDQIVVFRALDEDDSKKVLEILLGQVQEQLNRAKIPVLLQYSQPFKDFLVKEGFSREYGLREMEQAVKRHVFLPLSNALASGTSTPGDILMFRLDEAGKPALFREPRTDAMLVDPMGRPIRPTAGK